MSKSWSLMLLMCVSFCLNVSADTTRIWAVNAGSATRYGDFASDTNTGGWYTQSSATNLSELVSPAPAAVYDSGKYSGTPFSYTAGPLQPNGVYTLRLHYNENYANHTFSVTVNGVQVESSFNPYAAANYIYRRALIREYGFQADANGQCVITFAAVVPTYNSIINGIEVVEQATNNLVQPSAACWPLRVPGSTPATYKTSVVLSWPNQVFGNMLTNVFTVFRATNDWDSFAPITAVTNATRFADSGILPGQTNWYFVKRGVFSGTFGRTPLTNEYTAVVIPLADNYAVPYRRVWAVNCGYTGIDIQKEFAPDAQYSGVTNQTAVTVSAIAVPNTLDFPAPTNVYQTARWSGDAAGFSYAFPALTNRPYRLRLHFCEGWGITNRAFNFAVNGVAVTNNYNPSGAAGGNFVATIFDTDCMADTNGQIRVSFTRGSVDNPAVNGLEIVEFYYAPPPSGVIPVTVSNTWEAVAEVRSRVSNTAAYSGTVWRAEAPSGSYAALGTVPFNGGAWGDTPDTGMQTNKSYRYVVRTDSVTPDTNEAGVVLARFIPNRYSVCMDSTSQRHFVPPTGFVQGSTLFYAVGTAIDRSGVAGPAPLAVYQRQRYYGSPITILFTNLHANAAYLARLHFAETYHLAAGLRVIDILANGQMLYTRFDSVAFAGAANKAAAPAFRVQADSSGQILVTLNVVADAPLVGGVEIRVTPVTSAPASVSVERGSAKIAVTWTAVTGADGYAVIRTAEGGTAQEIGRVAGSSFADTTGVIGVRYTYTIQAYNEMGDGPAATSALVRYPAIKGTLLSIF